MRVTIKATPELERLARQAEEIQNASNMCGLAQTFAAVMRELVSMPAWVPPNQHPIARVWIDKFSSLAGLHQDWEVMSDMYRACRDLAEGRDAEFEYPAR